MKKLFITVMLVLSLSVCGCSNDNKLSELPKPEVTGGIRGE